MLLCTQFVLHAQKGHHLLGRLSSAGPRKPYIRPQQKEAGRKEETQKDRPCEFSTQLNVFNLKSHPLFWVMFILLFLFSLLSVPGPCLPQGLCTRSLLCLKYLSPFPYPAPSLPLSLSVIVPSADGPFLNLPLEEVSFLSSPQSQPHFSSEPFWQCARICWLISCQSPPLLEVPLEQGPCH